MARDSRILPQSRCRHCRCRNGLCARRPFTFQKPRPPILEARDDQFGSTVTVLSQQEHDLDNMQLAGTSTSPVDTSLRQNLLQVDEFIADCEQRLREVPSDDLAREYLTNAYQQKAELLSAMMDRGGSLN